MDWLEARRVPYEKLDVTADAPTFHEMISLSRQTLAPVIDIDGHVLADFDTDQLEAFWRELGLKGTSA